jgi:Meckel syndrome type 1 protein
MLEMSAAKSPALALTGAVSPAVAAAASADSAQLADFSVVLAGATLAGEAPAAVVDMLVQPEPDTPRAPELLPHPAMLPGKSGTPGNLTGKNLPAGKLPPARLAAVAEKAPRKLRNEGADLHNESTEAAPEQDAVVEPKSVEQVSAPITGATLALAEPTSTVPAPETADAVMLAAPAQDTTAPQATPKDAGANSEPTLTKLQSRAPAQIQTEAHAAKPVSVAIKPAPTKQNGAQLAEGSRDPVRDPLVGNQPRPLRAGAQAKTSLAEAAPSAPGIKTVTAPVIAGESNEPSSVSVASVAQTTGVGALIAQPTTGAATIALEPNTPATITDAKILASSNPATIVVAPTVARSTAGSPQALLPQDAEPVAKPRNAPVLTRATVSTLLAQTAPSALIPVTATAPGASLPTTEAVAESTLATPPALTSVSPDVELVADAAAGLARVTAPALPAVTPIDAPVAGVASAQGKAADFAATLPVATLPTAPAPAADNAAPIKPVSAAQATPAAGIVTPHASEPSAMAAPAQLALAPATTPTSVAATPTSVPAIDAAAIVSPAPIAQHRSPVLPAAVQPIRNEADVSAPLLAASDKDHKVVAAPISPATSTEVPALFARPQVDASTLAAEFRNAPSAPIATTSSTPATPTQDIAALVDRITEARAAASPHTIRASLVHEDFGAVSVNLRSEASHIHVTLGSADPGFAPAVQAAAAASLAGNGSDDANARRDAPMPQQFTPTQDTSARADTSSQQQAARDRGAAPERTGGRDAPGRQTPASNEREPSSSASRRRGGVYA